VQDLDFSICLPDWYLRLGIPSLDLDSSQRRLFLLVAVYQEEGSPKASVVVEDHNLVMSCKVVLLDLEEQTGQLVAANVVA